MAKNEAENSTVLEVSLPPKILRLGNYNRAGCFCQIARISRLRHQSTPPGRLDT